MGDLEKVGLLKMDFLGLRTLTLLDNAVKLIEKTRGETIDLYKLPLDDPETYRAACSAATPRACSSSSRTASASCSSGCRPDNIRDIIAATALYRPGPLEGGMVDAYVNCKHGRESRPYAHPVMEEILARDLRRHGLPGTGDADPQSARRHRAVQRLRLHQGHQQEEAGDHRPAARGLRPGAQERGVGKETAEEIFGLIVYFGGYGFNKSHSAAYALVSYQTAYLKAHYLPEFMAALLTSEIEDGNKRDVMVEHIADARRLGVEVLPPSVNASDGDFTVRDGRIVFGLTAIKGVGRGASEAIARARAEGGPFKDLFDFCERIDLKAVNKTALEKLVRPAPWTASAAIGRSSCTPCRAPSRRPPPRQEDKRRGQRNLFDAFGGDGAEAAPPRPPRRCPTCRSGRMRKSSNTRRRSSTSTSPATRWPSARRSCAASPATPPSSSSSCRPTRKSRSAA